MAISETNEDRVQKLGARLFNLAGEEAENRQGWLDLLVARAIKDEQFRLQTLRFIDVLPALQDDAELVAHLKEYFRDTELPWPAVSEWSLQHSDSPLAVHLAAPMIRSTLRGLSRRFMGGSNINLALNTIARLRSRGMSYSLDLLGEAVLSEQEADRYEQAYLDLLTGLYRSSHDDSKRVRPSISLKLSSLYSQINPLDPARSIAGISARLRPIFARAMACDACVTIDMEQYDFRHIVLECFMSVLMESEFRDWPDAGIAVQAYLRESRDSLEQLVKWAAVRGTRVTIRLVRGAYWDCETVIARQQGWTLPVWEHKAQTDANYESCLELLFHHHDTLMPVVATHNMRSLAFAMALAEQHDLSTDEFEFQMLYGMADDFKQALVKLGYPLRVYVPYGETLPGMAYLVRRLLENTSGQTILGAGMVQSGEQGDALKKPAPLVMTNTQVVQPGFQNLPVRRFIPEHERAKFAAAIDRANNQLGQWYPLIINNEVLGSSSEIRSYNPARPEELIGTVAAADKMQADMALAAARTAFAAWRDLSAAARATYLRKIADALVQRRDEFSAWEVLEAGKNWREADADVCEAVDFLYYYAAQAEQRASGASAVVSGELNEVIYQPRGVGLVIAPWNFPLAILAGMLSATIVTGNTAILKPSSLTPVIAARFMALIMETGLPPGVVNFLPGPGDAVGQYLANSPEISVIAFTGSRDVGTHLLESAAKVGTGQLHIKRVIAEMGGKNAIIIDADADLDDAVPGVVESAFGYQGQKCSAASRVIVVGEIHAAFIDRLREATHSLIMGDPQDPGNSMGPVIDGVALMRIRHVIEQGQHNATLITDMSRGFPARGHYLAPAIFTDVAPNDPLVQEEIFGPVLAVQRADTFEQALELANNTAYALTGGVYSRRPAHLLRAREAFQVGNLYLNRKITGALVSRQPFGGFKLSGVGSKAGGQDYLKQFMDPVCITENTLRRGFAPAPKGDIG